MPEKSEAQPTDNGASDNCKDEQPFVRVRILEVFFEKETPQTAIQVGVSAGLNESKIT